MKKNFKRAVASLSAVAMLVQGPITMATAQTMTPSQLIAEISEVNFDALEDIKSGEILGSVNAHVEGFQGFEFDLTGTAEGGFNLDVEQEFIEFLGIASGEVLTRYSLMNSDGEYEEVVEGPEVFDASSALKDGIFYSYDGTEATMQDVSEDLVEFFEEYEEGMAELKEDFAEAQTEITDFFTEEITAIIDNHFTVTESSNTLTLSLNEDFDPQAFIEDIRDTELYYDMMESIVEAFSTDLNVDPEELRSVAEELMTVFVGFFKEFNLTFMKESYILQGANFDFRIAAVDVFDIIHRANDLSGEPFISPEELSMYVMMLKDLLITVDGGYEMANINAEYSFEVPAIFDNARLIEPNIYYEDDDDDDDDFTTYEEPIEESAEDSTDEEVTFEDITLDEDTTEETSAE